MADFNDISDTVNLFSSYYLPSPSLHQLTGEELPSLSLPALPASTSLVMAPAQESHRLLFPQCQEPRLSIHPPSFQVLCHAPEDNWENTFSHIFQCTWTGCLVKISLAFF